MKFKVNSKNLQNALNICVGAIGNANILPILENFLFVIEDGNLQITSTDNNTTIKKTIQLDSVEVEGSVCVPAKLMTEWLKTLPEQTITFVAENNAIKLGCFSGNYEMASEDASDFPRDNVDGFEMVEANGLIEKIQTTLFCLSNDELRPAMTGVYLEANGTNISLCATDAHKLAVQSTASTLSNKGVILNGATCKMLKMLGDDIKFGVNDSHFIFESENTKIVGRVVDQRYPDYRGVIPNYEDGGSMKFTIEKKSLQSALKRLSGFSNQTTNQVIFNFNNDKLKLEAQDLDFQKGGKETVDVEGEGELVIAFNSKYFLEVLNNLKKDKLQIELSTSGRAALVREIENDEAVKGGLFLLMPVALPNKE